MLRIKPKLSLFLALLVSVGSVVPVGLVVAAPHSSGTNIISNGTVYMIADGQRRAYTSEGAFLSYGFNSWADVVPASNEDLAMNEGSFIPPRDGKIVCSDRGADRGTCYLISNGRRSAFVSAQIFNQLGFSFSKALYGDVSFLEKDADIADSTAQHRPGVLINKNGTIYLISSDGLMGIPNPEVLRTWGYSFADAITANSRDSQIAEYSVISGRQGAQLKPSDASALANATEEVIFQTYIDSYPALPTQVVSSPEDTAAVLVLKNTLEEVDFAGAYLHFSANSQTFLNKVPTFKKVLESEMYGVYDTEDIYTQVTVFEGRQKALVTATAKQTITNYTYPIAAVFVKENGVWKLDLVGTMRRGMDQEKADNPNDLYVSGSGSTDLGIEGMEYEQAEVMINDRTARFLVRIKNHGQTAVHKYGVWLYINDTEVYFSEITYKLLSGQEIILSLPIEAYWNPNIIRSPGQYKTSVLLEVLPANSDTDPQDNYVYVMTNFR